MKVTEVSKFFKSLASSQSPTALGARPKQAAAPRDTSALAAGLRQPLQPAETPLVTAAAANISSSASSWPVSTYQPALPKSQGEAMSFRPPLTYRRIDETLRHTTHDAVAAQSLLTLGHRRPSSRASSTVEKTAYTHQQRSPKDSVHEWLIAATTTGQPDKPPSIAESHATSMGRERQSSLPMGADAALMQPVQSIRSTHTRLTRRSGSSASVVLAELVNFARGTTESMLNLYDRNRADALEREQTLIQEAARREQEAARRDELAHFEKQRMRDEAKARDEQALAEKQKMRELALSEKQKVRDEAKAREELVFREKEQLRMEACKREESYMQAELKRKEIETAAATELQKQQIEANFKMQEIERREMERFQEKEKEMLERELHTRMELEKQLAAEKQEILKLQYEAKTRSLKQQLKDKSQLLSTIQENVQTRVVTPSCDTMESSSCAHSVFTTSLSPGYAQSLLQGPPPLFASSLLSAR